MKTEVIIVKNPFFYQEIAPDAFRELMPDGSWIPLVLQSVERVVSRRFFALCELDWDYLRDENSLSDEFSRYKSIYFRGLDDAQRNFAKSVADEIESEIRNAARDALLAKATEE